MTNSAESRRASAGRRLKVGLFLPVAETTLDGATPRWADIADLARRSEDAGFDSVWVMDHFLFPSPNGLRGSWDCWSLLAGLAAATRRISIGPLVSCSGFRNPALVAKMADTVDEISDGRLILGLGAGWNELEYGAFGFPFDHRVGRFEEAIGIIHGLLRDGHADFQGKYHQAIECKLVPRGPREGRIPILIGGRGERVLRLAARYADSWNSDWAMPAEVIPLLARVNDACRQVGRDPATLERTGALRIEFPPVRQYPLDEVYAQVSGSTEELAELLRSYADLGVSYLIVWLFPNMPTSIDAFAPVLEQLKRDQ